MYAAPAHPVQAQPGLHLRCFTAFLRSDFVWSCLAASLRASLLRRSAFLRSAFFSSALRSAFLAPVLACPARSSTSGVAGRAGLPIRGCAGVAGCVWADRPAG